MGAAANPLPGALGIIGARREQLCCKCPGSGPFAGAAGTVEQVGMGRPILSQGGSEHGAGVWMAFEFSEHALRS